MFCAQCGKPVADGARFCGHCGATVAAPATPPAEPAFTPPPPAAAAPSATFGNPGAGGTFGPTGTLPPPGATPGASAHGLVARVKGILLSPRTEWPVIAAEPRSARDIYLGYVAPLAAIGAIASFIGTTMIGFTVPMLGTVRVPIVAGLVSALVYYALTFAMVFLVSVIVDALAPTFGAQKDPLRALKVTAYSFTAGWVAAIVGIIPVLGIVALIGALYGLYLLYLGLPVLMKSPPDKSVGYTVVVVICAIVVGILVNVVTGLFVNVLGVRTGGLASLSAPRSADADADAAAAMVSRMLGGGSSADQARMKEAIGALEAVGAQAAASGQGAKAASTASASAGKPADVGVALNAVGTMMAGGRDVQPVDFHELKDMLPASLPGLPRVEATAQSGEAMSLKTASALARYSDGKGASVTIELQDLGSLSGIAAMASKFDPKIEKETLTGYERTRQVSGQLVHERYDRQQKDGETSVLVGGRFSVSVRGQGVDASQLTGALQAVDLARLPKLVAAK
jgi:hypothetical protein